MMPIASNNLPRVPFINARADRAVIDGHNQIWEKPVQEFIAHLIGRQRAINQLAESAPPEGPSASLPSPIAATNRD